MIYLEGLESIIESVYLNDLTSEKMGECKVFVNPENIKYLTGRTVILTGNKSYPQEKIEQLFSNGCKIISRTFVDDPRIEVQPYILRICFKVMWNGKTVTNCPDITDLFDSDDIVYRSGVLYFPKIYDTRIKYYDEYKNLTCLGWASQQVGVNLKEDTPFVDLDVIKTGKIVL